MMPGFTHYKPIPGVSVSVLDTISRCPRKAFYSFGVELAPRGASSIAMKFGEAIHAGLPDAHFGRLVEAISRFDKVWNLEDGSPRAGDDKRNPINGRQILAHYMETHVQNRALFQLQAPPSGTAVLSDRISDYEIPFVLDIGLPIPLVGRIDGWGLHRDTGKPWVVEYKTSSEMSTRFLDGFDLNPQVICYTMVLRSMGIPAEGAIVEAIKVSKAKENAHEVIAKPIYVTDEMISDFLKWARYTTLFFLACQDHQEFPKDISACSPYPQHGSPGYQCEFTPLCLMKDWTQMIGNYEQREYPTFKLLSTEVTINGQRAEPESKPEPGPVSDSSPTPFNPRRTIRVGQGPTAPGTLSSPDASNPNLSLRNPRNETNNSLSSPG